LSKSSVFTGFVSVLHATVDDPITGILAELCGLFRPLPLPV
jgi:hypothetical protein